MGGWVSGWVDGWMGGWMGVKARVKDCLQQSKTNAKSLKILILFWQLSETVADDRGISARIGRPWTSGGDIAVDRLMWQAVCVVGRKIAGGTCNNNINNNDKNNNNSNCLPVIFLRSTSENLNKLKINTAECMKFEQRRNPNVFLFCLVLSENRT